MFAVPGWAVDASTLVHQPKKPQDKTGAAAKTNSKKRKRITEPSEAQPFGKSAQTRPSADHDSHAKATKEAKPASAQYSKPAPSRPPPVNGGNVSKPRTKSHENYASTKNIKGAGKKEQRDEAVQPGNNTFAPTVYEHTPQKPEDGAFARSDTASPQVKLTPLQAKMRSKLTSARFRHLNETLYTTSSGEALALFSTSPDLFADYHAGFAQQVKDSWPQNPVEGYVRAVKTRGGLTEPAQGILPLPRRKTGSCTIADLGCGDAPLARGCQANIKTLKLRFHNYDLHAANTFVTKADVANLPLRDGEVDIAVFCLSLMGTNWISFVEEAWRILRGDGKGEIWVAEVKSRFGRVTKGRVVDNSVGKRKKPQKRPHSQNEDEYDGPEQFVEDERNASTVDDETDVSAFVKVFTRRGFQPREGSINKANKMFVSMVFTKSGIPTAGKHKGLKWNGREYVQQQQHDGKMRFSGGQVDKDDAVKPEDEAKVLKPCVYKTR